ncbi:MAG: hypothetical protein A3F17_03420 [Gammaproteobacteria bacterium RIFCSPHIGHO2_12_FULL_41_15]|nr:MAG: hypothetical protein A3F17_03420 [Gammaproteobacteria bacterium RIFCSPHIGHO2_12_FULL_41_15]
MSKFILSIVIAIVGFSTVYADSIVKKMYNVTSFDSIVADGYFNLSIQPYSGAKAFVKTSASAKNPIAVTVHGHTLYITSRYITSVPHPTVSVQLANLKGLQVYGPVNVNSSTIPSTQGLSLRSEGYGVVNLVVNNLRTIKQNGNNVIKISGIQSSKLALYAEGSGETTLKGKVNDFYARLNNHATLYARDLAADHISIQAKYNSHAYIHPIKSLRAFSDQSGEIYYYKHLNDLTRVPVQSGNVLEMQW